MKAAADVLKEARALLADEDNWTSYAMARDDLNKKVEARNRYAASWCAMGAVFKVAGDDAAAAEAALERLARAIGKNPLLYAAEDIVTEFNDNTATTHKELLEEFDAAIAAAERAR